MDMSCYTSQYGVGIKSPMNSGIDLKQIPRHGQYSTMLLILWFSRYRVVKLLGVDTLIIFMKPDFCLTKYGQTWFPAELGSGMCTALQRGTAGGLEAAPHSLLSWLLSCPVREQEQSRTDLLHMGGLWVWEWVQERAGLGWVACSSRGMGEELPTLLPPPWTAGAMKASSRVLVLSNIRAAGKMKVRSGREIPNYTQGPLKP